jgi:hypothetical protein
MLISVPANLPLNCHQHLRKLYDSVPEYMSGSAPFQFRYLRKAAWKIHKQTELFEEMGKAFHFGIDVTKVNSLDSE